MTCDRGVGRSATVARMDMSARGPFARDRTFAAGLIRRVLRDKCDTAFDAFRQTPALAQNDARAAQVCCMQHSGYLISRVLLPPVPRLSSLG